MEYINSLKNLYKLNESQLDRLSEHFKKHISINNIKDVETSLNSLVSDQYSIKNKIPRDRYNLVNSFIMDIMNYINQFNNTIKSTSKINKVFNQNDYLFDKNVMFNKEQSNLKPPKNKTDDDIDPYKLYGYTKGQKIDINDLKSKYKKYALETHPDKNGGNPRNFNIINNAFKVLYEDYKLRQEDKQFTELKNSSRSFIEKQQGDNYQNINMSSENFDSSKFNRLYEKHRLSDVNDDGYGNWSKENEFASEDIVKDPKLTSGNFNSMFNRNVKVSNQLTKYQKPMELFMNDNNGVMELGKDKIDNYTGKTKTINFTDYKEAHTTSRLVDPDTKYNQYESINHIKSARSNIKELTAEEIMEMELESARKIELEKKRISNLKNSDERHFENYNKVHNMMLRRG